MYTCSSVLFRKFQRVYHYSFYGKWSKENHRTLTNYSFLIVKMTSWSRLHQTISLMCVQWHFKNIGKSLCFYRKLCNFFYISRLKNHLFFGCLPRSEIAGSLGRHSFSFEKTSILLFYFISHEMHGTR